MILIPPINKGLFLFGCSFKSSLGVKNLAFEKANFFC